MLKFIGWFVCAASLLVFVVVVCDSAEESAAKKSTVLTLTEEQKQALVDKHNDHRRREGASNMQKMKWNQYIADMAEEWAGGCVFEHGNPHRDPKELPFQPIGQNLLASNGKLDLVNGLDAWLNEAPSFNYGNLSCRTGAMCGHYTQMVWAGSTDLGCGAANCTRDKKPWYIYVCNYGPAGNYVGAKPYEKGPACSKCKEKQVCDDGLCKN